MTVLAFRFFAGEIPRQPDTLLPENASQDAVNCDLAHGELRGLRGDRLERYGTSQGGAAIRSVYTEDGINFFGWPYDVYPVKSLVVDDLHHRIYYTAMLSDGPLAKVARTHRNNNGVVTPVIGALVPNFHPPESNTFLVNGLDSWVLGVPAPRVQAAGPEENLAVTLEDREEWPDAPGLRLRVTLFYEDDAGTIVHQQDISNNESAAGRNVFYTVNPNDRASKIQDMLWPLGGQRKPYKFYFLTPPAVDINGLVRPVTIANDAATAITFDYGSSNTHGTPGGPGLVA